MNEEKLNSLTREEAIYYLDNQMDYTYQLQQENQRLKQWNKNKDTRNSRQRVANAKLLKENQQLKQKYEMQKDSNKLLCKAITCDDCDCKVCEAHKENIKYKSVLDEIKEQLKLERKIALSLNKPYTVSVIDKLLDKVGKE